MFTRPGIRRRAFSQEVLCTICRCLWPIRIQPIHPETPRVTFLSHDDQDVRRGNLITKITQMVDVFGNDLAQCNGTLPKNDG